MKRPSRPRHLTAPQSAKLAARFTPWLAACGSQGDLNGYSPPPGDSSSAPSYGYERRDHSLPCSYVTIP